MFWIFYLMVALGSFVRAEIINRFSLPGNFVGAIFWPISLGMAIEEMAWPKEEE